MIIYFCETNILCYLSNDILEVELDVFLQIDGLGVIEVPIRGFLESHLKPLNGKKEPISLLGSQSKVQTVNNVQLHAPPFPANEPLNQLSV